MAQALYRKKAEEAPQLLEDQRAFFERGHTRNIAWRCASLQRLEKELARRTDDALAALAQDLGKPEAEAYLSEVYFLRKEIQLTRKRLRRWLKPQCKTSPLYFFPMTSRVMLEPYGCVLVMAAWNYPLQLALAPVISAVAAGNTVILKPSESASATECLLGELVTACFEPEHVSVVTGSAEVAEELTGLDFDFIFFTGSERVGKLVARRAASRMIPCVMELGGKCPCVVDPSVDLAIAARRILAGKLFNAGQTCFAPDFVIVHESCYDELVGEMQRLLREGRWAHDLARLVDLQHYERVKDLAGPDALIYGRDEPEALRLAPRLVLRPEWSAPCMQEEIFGPVLPVLAYKDSESLIRQLRRLSSPLALYCFSRRKDFISILTRSLRSGSVCVNDTMKQAANLALPFGGVGASGYGRYRAEAGVEAFSYRRSIARRFFLPDPFALMPPYGDKIRLLRRWLK
ncbi:aldehyde dehydrogenase family protein [Ruficoccus amylovorans]|uniref:Aldehyde dehydrogenase n=1 Tax=Ruficoccus amylovorans TaxID=1804625 RepID=A0A842HFV4_9BACT|nr:aldehyde dehydrogenase family protein [Ruficoccus amylovorans]MBC2594457.1 aldehyde dehydrogenase family protein [Ruficoccus amylovorans]